MELEAEQRRQVMTADWLIARQQKEAEDKEAVQEAFRTIIDKINCMGFEKVVGEAVIEELQRTHRTLHQRIFADVIVPVIKHYAQTGRDGFCDDRNRASCEKAQELEALLEDAAFPFI
jgi:hypothetical protein